MKKLVILVLGTLSLVNVAMASTVISERIEILPVVISSANVKLSRADYSMPVVKVLVPALADVTILNHRNSNEGAPCLATYDTSVPADVIQNHPATEEIDFTITLEKFTNPTTDGKCQVTLVEHVSGVIRGFDFKHERSTQLPDRHIDDCR